MLTFTGVITGKDGTWRIR